MKKIIGKVIQALADFVVGIAFYFSLHSIVPSMGSNAIFMISLIITVLFAEMVEMKWKK